MDSEGGEGEGHLKTERLRDGGINNERKVESEEWERGQRGGTRWAAMAKGREQERRVGGSKRRTDGRTRACGGKGG
eukprot:554520-Rhodomonas_salina.1